MTTDARVGIEGYLLVRRMSGGMLTTTKAIVYFGSVTVISDVIGGVSGLAVTAARRRVVWRLRRSFDCPSVTESMWISALLRPAKRPGKPSSGLVFSSTPIRLFGHCVPELEKQH